MYFAIGGGGGAVAAAARRGAGAADNSQAGSIRSASTVATGAGSRRARSPECSRRPIVAWCTSVARFGRPTPTTQRRLRAAAARRAEVGFPIERLTIAGGGGGGGGGGRRRGGGGRAAGGAAGAAGEPVNFSFNVRVDRREEWKQMLDESYRVMKYRYYDPKMHGKDWTAIYAQVQAAAQVRRHERRRVRHRQRDDRRAEHVAHGRERPVERHGRRAYATRYLGFEIEPANGKYRVTHVYRDGPADKEWIDIKAGDYVLAIDGQDIKAGDDYWKILSSTENEYIPVKVSKTPDGAGAKTFRIASATNLTNIKYEEWVANNRDSVDKATGGQIAYVHIRAMDQPSLERFQNEIDRFWQKKGIIVDIRNNGGGNIDQELLDILERQPYQFWNNRNGARTWGRRPRQAIVGPKVMMINYRSVSDAEVTPAGFRQLGLGRIVGNPTSAQVIATGATA